MVGKGIRSAKGETGIHLAEIHEKYISECLPRRNNSPIHTGGARLDESLVDFADSQMLSTNCPFIRQLFWTLVNLDDPFSRTP